MIIAAGGPTHSGKSVFIAELYRQLLARKPSGAFLQRACPDGEGMWSDEADPIIVKEIRRKGDFSYEFMSFTLDAIVNLGMLFPIVLVDLGGLRTAENAEILKRCSHLIILSSRDNEIKPWQEFAAAEGCKTLAIFSSRLVRRKDGSLDEDARSRIDLGNVPIQGEFVNLDRKSSNHPYREAISQLADWLIVSVVGEGL